MACGHGHGASHLVPIQLQRCAERRFHIPAKVHTTPILTILIPANVIRKVKHPTGKAPATTSPPSPGAPTSSPPTPCSHPAPPVTVSAAWPFLSASPTRPTYSCTTAWSGHSSTTTVGATVIANRMRSTSLTRVRSISMGSRLSL